MCRYHKLYGFLARCMFLVALLLFTGCIKDDECPVEVVGVSVTLRVTDPADESAVTDASIYVFGADGRFLERRETVLNRVETFLYPDAGQLTFVGWCNIEGGEVNVTPVTTNTTIDQLRVSLKPNASIPGIYNSPSDLFFGTQEANGSTNVTISAVRKAARMTITVVGLKEFAGFNDNNYTLEVGTTPSQIDFHGQYFDPQAIYRPISAFDLDEKLVAPVFNLMPSQGEVLYVRIYHAGTLVYQTIPLEAIAGQTLNVLINFASPSNIIVSMMPSRWGEIFEWEIVYD